MIAAENDEPAKARAALEKLLQLDDKSVIALTQLGQLEIKAENYHRAVEHLGRAHELRPEDAALALDYARAQEFGGDLASARDTLQATLKVNPHQFPALLLLGQVYLRLGNETAALDELEDAAVMQPENVEAKVSLSQVLIIQRKFTDVVELLEPVASSSGNNADVFAALAEAYRGLGRSKDAERAEAHVKALRKPKK
jgi:predicted Zn-dependent protease